MGFVESARARGALLIIAAVLACAGGLMLARTAASGAAARHGRHGRVGFGVVLGRPAFAPSRREAHASALRVTGARADRRFAQAGRELTWRRRANSDTYEASSGRLMTRIYPYPINYRASSGRFAPISARLVPSAAGYRQQANDLGLRVPASASGEAHVAVAHGGLAVRLLGASGRGAVSGTAERFMDALSGVNFAYVSQTTGLGWQAQMSAARASQGLSWLVRGSAGLSAKVVAGGVQFRDRRGNVVWVFRPPTAVQQGVNRPVVVRLSIHRVRGGVMIHAEAGATERPHSMFGVLALTPGSFAAADTSTSPSSPQTWDGQIIAGSFFYLSQTEQTGDCYVASGSPTTSLCGGNTNYVGPDDNTLENFDVADNLPSHVQILQSFVVMGLSSASSTTAENIGVWEAAKPWTDAATWDTYDGTNAWATPGGDTTGAMLDYESVGASGDVGNDFYWDITPAMQGWVDQNPAQEDGLIFQAEAGTSAPNTLGFNTSTNSSDNPYIEVYYEPRLGDYPGAKYDSQQLTNRSSLGVNVATGNLFLSNDDLDLAGVNGLDLDIGRYYNNLSTDQDAFGDGWSMGAGADTYLAIPCDPESTIAYFDGTGSAQTFNTGATGTTEIAPPGLDAQLTMNNSVSTYASSTFTMLFRHSGITETFTSPAGACNKVARLSTITDRNGNKLTYSYNSSNQLTSITDSYGNTTTITWSPEGYISEITDPTGREYKYFQNSSGQLTQYEDPAGNSTDYTYDTYGNLTQIKSPAGRITNVTYDAGNTNEVESVERLVNASDTSGPTWTYQANAPNACVSPGAGWTADTVEDPDRHTTTYCTDDLSRLAEVFDAAGNEQSTSYTTDGYVASTTDQLGTPTTFSYSDDGNDNITKIQDGATGGGGSGGGAYSSPETTNLSYSGTAGSANQYLPSSSQDASGNTTSYQYGTGASGSYGAGEPTSISDGLSTQNTAHLTYNSNGTVATSTDPDGNETTYSYTSGNLTTVTPPAGSGLNTIHLTYDAANRLASVSTANGSSGHSVSYSYNDLDQLIQAVYANDVDSTTEIVGYSYDQDGNLTGTYDTVGSTTTSYYYGYDGLDRLVGETLADGSYANYTLDPVGNVTAIDAAGGDVNYTYNNLNEATSVTDPSQGRPVATFTYDAAGRLLNTVYSTGVSDDNLYNALGQLIKTTDTYKTSSGGTTHLSYVYGYTNGGLRSSVTDQSGDVTSYSYDALDRLTTAQTKNTAGTTTAEYQYQYDGNGNTLALTTSGSAIAAGTTSYAYNPGNEICWSYSGTAASSCGTVPTGAHSFSYDADGNELSNGNGLTMTYNSLGQMSSATIGGVTSTYSYIGADEDQLASDGSSTLDTEAFGIADITSSAGSTAYTRTPSGQLLDQRAPGGTYDYLYDGAGNVVGLTNSAGQLVDQYGYDPSGDLSASAATVQNPFQFQAGYVTASGLEHFGARFLDAAQGSWTQPDPLAFTSYSYAGDDPVNNQDLDGELFNRIAESTCVRLTCCVAAWCAHQPIELPPRGRAIITRSRSTFTPDDGSYQGSSVTGPMDPQEVGGNQGEDDGAGDEGAGDGGGVAGGGCAAIVPKVWPPAAGSLHRRRHDRKKRERRHVKTKSTARSGRQGRTGPLHADFCVGDG